MNWVNQWKVCQRQKMPCLVARRLLQPLPLPVQIRKDCVVTPFCIYTAAKGLSSSSYTMGGFNVKIQLLEIKELSPGRGIEDLSQVEVRGEASLTRTGHRSSCLDSCSCN